VTTYGAITIDTLPPRTLKIPRFSESTFTATPGPCGGWQLFTPERNRDLLIVYGAIGGRFLNTIEATPRAPRPPSGTVMDCSRSITGPEFFAFIPGGVGDTPVDPLVLWVESATEHLVLTPTRHLVQPAFQFKVEDLRASARSGTRVDMRIVVEGAEPETFPIFVTRRASSQPLVTFGRLLSEDTWEYPYINSDGSGKDVQYFIYLLKR